MLRLRRLCKSLPVGFARYIAGAVANTVMLEQIVGEPNVSADDDVTVLGKLLYG